MRKSNPRTFLDPKDYLKGEEKLASYKLSRQPQSVILFAAPYPAAVANLGYLTIWEILNRKNGFSCDRAVWDPRTASFSPGLESGLPLRKFPLILISSSFELDLIAIIDGLLKASIEPDSLYRGVSDPLIVAGGMNLTLNPAPWSSIIDLALLGEGEEAVREWIQIYQDWRYSRESKQDLIHSSARLPYTWIPSLPERIVIPAKFRDYPNNPANSPITHPQGHFGDCQLVEVSRGCPRHCLFCAVSETYSARFARVPAIIQAIKGRETSEKKKIGLLGAAVGDHPQLKDIVKRLLDDHYELTVSSLRIDRTDEELLEMLVKAGLKTLTVAPEAGGEDLRVRLGKKSTNNDLVRLVKLAVKYSLRRLRLYFVIGLPEPEPPEKIVELIRLLQKACAHKVSLDLRIASFIPKPGTPYERSRFLPVKELDGIKKTLHQGLSGMPNVSVKFESTKAERLAALLSRGDAHLGKMLLEARRHGRTLEQEMMSNGLKIEPLLGEIDPSQMLPWGMIKAPG